MGKQFGIFKYQIGDIISDEKRNIKIIDRYYVTKQKFKNGKPYNQNEKWYKYKCLKCGNEDAMAEYSIYGQHHGCNVCCSASKKIIKGINDISTTASWMMDYIIDKDYCYNNAKYSKIKTKMKCPLCNKITEYSPYLLFVNNGLSCSCKDGNSYPNKYMFALLSQMGIEFEPEKTFSWSDNKRYDFYIVHNGKHIICEMNGLQHYQPRESWTGRTLEEEIKNDDYKKTLALNNNIDCYFQINSSISDPDYIKSEITLSGILEALGLEYEIINWSKCAEFATSSIYKTIAEYHELNPYLNRKELASYFNVSLDTVITSIKYGIKLGWCNLSFRESQAIREAHDFYNHGIKPVYCITSDSYYRSVVDACNTLTAKTGVNHSQGTLRQYIKESKLYKGKAYIYISQEEFNEAKSKFPDKCHGNFFNIKENVA